MKGIQVMRISKSIVAIHAEYIYKPKIAIDIILFMYIIMYHSDYTIRF